VTYVQGRKVFDNGEFIAAPAGKMLIE